MAEQHKCDLCRRKLHSLAIQCSLCDIWTHRTCACLSLKEFRRLGNCDDNWYCNTCINIFPFQNETNDFFLEQIKNADDSSSTQEQTYKTDTYQNFTNHDFNGYYHINEISMSESTFSLMHINARSLIKNLDTIKTVIYNIKPKLDAIAISETWLKDNNADEEIKISGYSIYRSDRKGKKGGGVALYTSNNIKSQLVHQMSKENVYEEITICTTINKKQTIIACIYRPPNGEFNLFHENFEVFLKRFSSKNIIITGDFNINLKHGNLCKYTNTFLQIIENYNIYPIIKKPTRITKQSSTVIDNIFTNLQYTSKGILISDISDHLPVFAEFENARIKVPCQELLAITKVNIKNVKESLATTNWKLITTEKNTDTAFQKFLDILNDTIQKNTKTTLSKKKRLHQPWITAGLIKSCRRKNRLYKNFLKSKTAKSEEKYKSYKNNLTKLLRSAKRKFFSEKIQSNVDNPKETWKTIGNILNKKNTDNNLPTSLKDANGLEISSKQDIANLLNEFFANIGTNLATKINSSQANKPSYYMGTQNTSSMFIYPTDEREILKIISKTAKKKSQDAFCLSMAIIKDIKHEIIAPLTTLCNLSLSSGKFPDVLKIAKIIPVFKKGDKQNPTNYRPISLLPQISKILEKLFELRLRNFLIKHNLLNNCQYGFRNKHSTSHALLDVLEQVTNGIDQSKTSIGCFLDLRKAFDTVDHNILLSKLLHYGLRGKAHAWITSYLNNRQQYVSLQNIKSNICVTTCGVPQGSILGPLLFLVYINDICSSSKHFHFVLFADDTNIFISDKNINRLQDNTNQELNKLSDWFKANKLSLNIEKTNYIVFSKKKIRKLDLRINNQSIQEVNSTKFLGVYLDKDISWKTHCDYVRQKLIKINAITYRIRDCLDLKTLKTIYHSLFLPHLTYCLEIWGTGSNQNLTKLFLCQKKMIRTITFSSFRDHTNPLFARMNMLKAHELLTFSLCSLVNRAKYNHLPTNLNSMFKTKRENVHYLRKKGTMEITFCRTTLRSQCASILGVKMYNNLPQKFQETVNINQFKKQLKKYLLDRYREEDLQNCLM